MSLPILDHWLSISVHQDREDFVLSVMTLIAKFAVCYFVWLAVAQTDGEPYEPNPYQSSRTEPFRQEPENVIG